MGLPHVGMEDCVYEGNFIPKGALVMANIWQISHDPSIYKDPHVFLPERFLGENPEMDTHNLIFGFGRRVCPGKELADHTLFLTIAMSLAVFDISSPLDDSGKPMDQPGTYLPGLITKPADFPVHIVPRSAKAEALVNSITFDQPFEKGDSDALEGLKWTKQHAPFPATY